MGRHWVEGGMGGWDRPCPWTPTKPHPRCIDCGDFKSGDRRDRCVECARTHAAKTRIPLTFTGGEPEHDPVDPDYLIETPAQTPFLADFECEHGRLPHEACRQCPPHTILQLS